jgi:hypothetical protein
MKAMYYAFHIVPDAVLPVFVDDNMRLRSNTCYAAEGFSPERREDWSISLQSECE